MIYTTINATISDQSMQLSNLPLLASGSKGVLRIACTFCEKWTGLERVGVFYRNKENVYHVPFDGDEVTAPKEVLVDAGGFYFGIMGIGSGEVIRTTEAVKVILVQGAVTASSATAEEPAPDLYSQLLASWAKGNARINQLVKMGSTQGAIAQELTDEYISGSILSNGAAAYINFTISGMSLVAGGWHYTDYCVLPANAPLGPVQLKTSNPDINVTLLPAEEQGWARMLIENPSSSYFDTYNTVTVEGFYPLASMSVAELGDVRVGYDGREYETAGEAVRRQIEGIMGLPDVDPGELPPAVIAELLDAYRDLTARVEVAEEAAREAASAAASLPKHYIQATEPTNWSDGELWIKVPEV
jgi:hypothetical protein